MVPALSARARSRRRVCRKSRRALEILASPAKRSPGSPSRIAESAAAKSSIGGSQYKANGSRIMSTLHGRRRVRSEEHTSELQSLMRISYAVFCLKKKNKHYYNK